MYKMHVCTYIYVSVLIFYISDVPDRGWDLAPGVHGIV